MYPDNILFFRVSIYDAVSDLKDINEDREYVGVIYESKTITSQNIAVEIRTDSPGYESPTGLADYVLGEYLNDFPVILHFIYLNLLYMT